MENSRLKLPSLTVVWKVASRNWLTAVSKLVITEVPSALTAWPVRAKSLSLFKSLGPLPLSLESNVEVLVQLLEVGVILV